MRRLPFAGLAGPVACPYRSEGLAVPKITRKVLPAAPKPDAERGKMDDPQPTAKKEGERLAVNLFDLLRLDPLIRQLMLGGKLDLAKAIKVDAERLDETAVEFTCDLLTAACCCDAIRLHDRGTEPYPTRVYLMRRNGTVWERLPHATILTLVEDGRVLLSPKVFRVEAVPVAPTPPKEFVRLF